MNPNRTPSRPQHPPSTGLPFLVLFAALCVTLLVLLAVFWPWESGDTPTGTVDATDGDPAVATPVATEAPELRLTLDPPLALSDVQALYIHRAGIVPFCPLCVGVDRPPLDMSDNEIVLWQALFGTETSFRPWDEYGNALVSSAGCVGASQICNMDICGGVNHADRYNPELSLYLGACYFDELIDRYSGDYTLAIAAYKGALVDGVVTHPEQVASVWQYVGVVGK